MRKMTVLQLVLLGCLCLGQAQDSLPPNLDIFTELQKLRDVEAKVTTLEKQTEEQKALIKTLEEESEATKTTLQATKNQMEELQKDIEDGKVAFSVALLASGEGHTGPFYQDHTIIYKKIFANVGNAYNPDTGIFTAPVKGFFFFRFYGHAQNLITMAVGLYKNGSKQCSVYAHEPVSNANGSNGVVLNLEVGDQVYTALQPGARVYDDPNSYSSFSGFLLFKQKVCQVKSQEQ